MNLDTALYDRFDDEWKENSAKERGHVLTGRYAHYCFDWDGLSMDETCPEFPCTCFTKQQLEDSGFVL